MKNLSVFLSLLMILVAGIACSYSDAAVERAVAQTQAAMPTNTPVPPTATAVPTNTPVPPTATPSGHAISGVIFEVVGASLNEGSTYVGDQDEPLSPPTGYRVMVIETTYEGDIISLLSSREAGGLQGNNKFFIQSSVGRFDWETVNVNWGTGVAYFGFYVAGKGNFSLKTGIAPGWEVDLSPFLD